MRRPHHSLRRSRVWASGHGTHDPHHDRALISVSDPLPAPLPRTVGCRVNATCLEEHAANTTKGEHYASEGLCRSRGSWK